MMTNWKVNFTDGTSKIVSAHTFGEALASAEFTHGKNVRSAQFHSSFMDTQPIVPDSAFGYGWGPV